jgi:two-component system nitrate/nitrite response regulator NarL
VPPALRRANCVRFEDVRTRDLAQNEPQHGADAPGSPAGSDRAFRSAFATALVGPNFLALEGLKGILRAAGFRVVASAARVNDLVFDPELQGQPILLVVNADDGLRATINQIELFKVRHESGHVVLLADPGQHSGIRAAFHAGASGYLFMGQTTEPFIKALELVMLGETVLPSVLLPFILDREDEAIPVSANENLAPLLSPRQRLILRHLAEGQANKVIANKLGIAEATVKVHVKSILSKIGVLNRTQAAMWAMNNGLFIGEAGSSPPRRPRPASE